MTEDARHRRDRLWILANATSQGPHAGTQAGIHSCEKITGSRNGQPKRQSRWANEPELARMVDGIPTRMDRDRIKALGNAIVPQVAYEILRCISAV